jgi:ABC-2 type transport system ATP-binding protein
LELSERLQLDLTRKFQDLSHGNKQKVGIVQAFMHRPQLLILDEPTLGLDPLMQRELRKLIDEVSNLGATVVLSSHVLSEVESFCTRIGLINKGRIVRVGTLAELRSSRIHKISIQFEGVIPTKSELESAGAQSVNDAGQIVNLEIRGSIDQVLKVISKYQVVEIDSRELSLEEVFFSEVSG